MPRLRACRRAGTAGCIIRLTYRRPPRSTARTRGRSRTGPICQARRRPTGRAVRPWRRGAARAPPATTGRGGRQINSRSAIGGLEIVTGLASTTGDARKMSDRWPLKPAMPIARPTVFALLAVIGAVAAAPAHAQFNPFEAIFGPFRPPADVPGGRRLPPGPPPSQYPPDTRLPPGPPPSQQYPQQYPPSARLPPGVQTQPLPAPGGGAARPAPPRRPSQPGEPPQPSEIVTPPGPKIPNPTAVFSGLDKITGRIITFDVALNETVQFGALQVTPRVCYTRPPTETPNTDAFLEVDEVTLQGEVKRIFTGWMFAASPGLHGVEHPIYDVWLTDCKNPVVAAAPPPPEAAPAPAAQPAKPPPATPARRSAPQVAPQPGQPPRR